MMKRMLKNALLIGSVLAVAGCGGGGSGDASSTNTTLTGSVVKGPVGNATVTVKKPDGTACGTTSTDAVGHYALPTTCVGDVIIEATGGTYTDEATNTTKTLDTPLRAVFTASGGTVDGVVTPLTTMAFGYAFASASAATKSAFDAQAAVLATQFGLAGVNIATTLPIVSGTTDAYGKVLKGISQLLKDNPAQTLTSLTTASFNSAADLAAFSTLYNAAYNQANGTNVTLTFDGSAFNIAGSGATGLTGTYNYQIATTIAAVTIPPTIYRKNSAGNVTDSIYCSVGKSNSGVQAQLTLDAAHGTASLNAGGSGQVIGSYNAGTGAISLSDIQPKSVSLVGTNGTTFYSESAVKFDGNLNPTTGSVTGTYSELSATTWSLDSTRQECTATGTFTATKI